MATLKGRKLTSILAAVAIASAHLLVPQPAEAASGLFRMLRTWYGSRSPFTSTDFHPNLRGPHKAPPAKAYVGATAPAPRFTAPQSFIIDTTYYYACPPGLCFDGYPESKGWYSYWNLRGDFRPNNPNGATMATTVRFTNGPVCPAVIGTDGERLPCANPPLGKGTPITPTTTFSGRYMDDRGGSIMITPGPNRFGGTMQFFYGPNHRYYQLITISSPYITKAYGPGQSYISADHPSGVGEWVIGGPLFRYRMTSAGQNRAQTTTPSGAMVDYVKKATYLYTIAPFTTGMIQAYQPVGDTVTIHSYTGYDNREVSTMGGFQLSGIISMVRPRLVHTYTVPVDPNEPIRMSWSSARTWQMDFHFLPEPGSAVMMASGLVALAGLYRLRKR